MTTIPETLAAAIRHHQAGQLPQAVCPVSGKALAAGVGAGVSGKALAAGVSRFSQCRTSGERQIP